jgi:3-methyladenine DNA glycosylase/8-oxoguanine DNA glycosylase
VTEPRRRAHAFDPTVATRHLTEKDPVLGRLIARVGPFSPSLKRTTSAFSALAEAIVYQQLNGRAAASIYGRVCALFPGGARGPRPEDILACDDASLRAAGLSRAKLAALRDLAARTRSGELPTLPQLKRMEDEAIIERLTVVRGIGRWTAEMLLIFRLGRPDVLPADDYGVRQGFRLAFRKRQLPSRQQLLAHGARWAPYRSVASWYLWRALELA